MHAQIFLSIVPGEVLQHTPSKYNLRSCHSVQALGVTMSVHISLSGNCLNGFALQKLTRSSWLFRLGGDGTRVKEDVCLLPGGLKHKGSLLSSNRAGASS